MQRIARLHADVCYKNRDLCMLNSSVVYDPKLPCSHIHQHHVPGSIAICLFPCKVLLIIFPVLDGSKLKGLS